MKNKLLIFMFQWNVNYIQQFDIKFTILYCLFKDYLNMFVSKTRCA